jgi:2-iminobutanoate/2-iminopropanoate deaminase
LLAGDGSHTFQQGGHSLGHCLVAAERIASYTRTASPEFIFKKASNGGLAVNRRFGFLAVALVVAGIVSVNGALSQPTPQTTRKVFNAPEKTVQAPYSDGILAGNTLYLAGRIGLDPKTGKPPAEIEDEIKLMLDSLKGTLTQAGMTMDDLVYVQIACTDLSLFDKFNPIYKSYFKTTDYPAREFIGAGSLLRGGHFELQAIAVRR